MRELQKEYWICSFSSLCSTIIFFPRKELDRELFFTNETS